MKNSLKVNEKVKIRNPPSKCKNPSHSNKNPISRIDLTGWLREREIRPWVDFLTTALLILQIGVKINNNKLK